MNRLLSTIAFATAAVTLQPAFAETAAHTQQPPQVVRGVALSSLCAECGVVSNVRSETRKGKASGIGAVGGAVAGGVVGHQLGGGSGRTALTLLGAVGGGVAGNEVEKNVKKYSVWITTVTFRDGAKKKYEATRNPGLKAGDVVHIENGHPLKRAV